GQQAHDMLITRQGTYATIPSEYTSTGHWKSTDWEDPHRLLLRALTRRLMGI
ncbi:Hypothetical predicted protein, partial [Pelobates cultripes]